MSIVEDVAYYVFIRNDISNNIDTELISVKYFIQVLVDEEGRSVCVIRFCIDIRIFTQSFFKLL